MVTVDLDIVNNEIDTYGELVTITVKSDKTYSDWGDESATETETEDVKAVFNVYGQPSVFQPEADFQEGDVAFFFKSGQSGLVVGTKITRTNAEVYEISDTRAHGIQGNIYVNEMRVKKI